MKKVIKINAAMLALVLVVPAWAVDSGTLIKADELKAEPFRDAKTVSKVNAGEKVEILGKNAGWLQIKTAKNQGWVRMLSVRKGAASTSSGPDVAGVAGLMSGRSGTGKVVATTGIRGLNEEELKTAKFNEEELKRSESFMTSRADAQQFAKAGKLTARSVDFLPGAKK